MNDKTKEMLRWHKKYHKPISRERLSIIAEYIQAIGEVPASSPLDANRQNLLWNDAFDLLLEVRRLNRIK